MGDIGSGRELGSLEVAPLVPADNSVSFSGKTPKPQAGARLTFCHLTPQHLGKKKAGYRLSIPPGVMEAGPPAQAPACVLDPLPYFSGTLLLAAPPHLSLSALLSHQSGSPTLKSILHPSSPHVSLQPPLKPFLLPKLPESYVFSFSLVPYSTLSEPKPAHWGSLRHLSLRVPIISTLLSQFWSLRHTEPLFWHYLILFPLPS